MKPSSRSKSELKLMYVCLAIWSAVRTYVRTYHSMHFYVHRGSQVRIYLSPFEYYACYKPCLFCLSVCLSVCLSGRLDALMMPVWSFLFLFINTPILLPPFCFRKKKMKEKLVRAYSTTIPTVPCTYVGTCMHALSSGQDTNYDVRTYVRSCFFPFYDPAPAAAAAAAVCFSIRLMGYCCCCCRCCIRLHGQLGKENRLREASALCSSQKTYT